MFSLISNLILAVLIPDIAYIPPEVAEIAPQAIEMIEVVDNLVDNFKPKDCSCVQYVRDRIPELPRGDAIDQKLNSHPVENGAIVFGYGHIAYIEKMLGNVMLISEANYKKCQITKRYIGYGDPAIKGFANY